MKSIFAFAIVLLPLRASAANTATPPSAPLDSPSEHPPTPCERVSKFLAENLKTILSPLDPNVDMPQVDLVQLNADLTAEAAVAPQNEKPRYQAVLSVCKALFNAMDEHQKARANFDASLRAQPSGTLGDTTKQTRKYYPYYPRIESAREQAAQHKAEAVQRDSATSARANSRWAERSIQLMQGIKNLHATALKLERGQVETSQTPRAR